jgi:hypothetical protein
MKDKNQGLPLGKLPANLLERLLKSIPAHGPDVITGPGIGHDAAVVNFDGLRLIFHSKFKRYSLHGRNSQISSCHNPAS